MKGSPETQNEINKSLDTPKISKQEDKLVNLISKWQKETRDEIKKKGEKDFDFLGSDPSGLTERIKESTRQFVEDEWMKLS